MDPAILFALNAIPAMEDKYSQLGGIDPVSEFELKCITLNLLIVQMFEGIDLLSELWCSQMPVSAVKAPNVDGMTPVKEL